MPPHTPPGRVLTGGRIVARVLLVWGLTTGALLLLDRWLTGFRMTDWWQPPVAALLLGVLAGVVWPLLMRIALPIAFFTLGLGGFLVLGAGVLGIFLAIPGVEVTSFKTSVVVAVSMAGVAALISSLLAIDEDELFFRRARRKRTDGEATPVPGVLFLQVDGLGHATAQRAVRDGTMPTLAAWLREGSHRLTWWHTDWSSQTGASVCGILQGSNFDVVGFRWYEKDRDRVLAVSHPEDAALVEARHSDGGGLLAPDGAGRGNLFTGDARYVSLTMSSLAVVVPQGSRRARRGRDRVGAGYYAYFANPVNALRTLTVSLVDVVRELVAAGKQRRADVRPRIDRGGLYPLARPGTTVIARDVVVAALIEDMLAGRPVAYADFLGYDEVAHHSGIERFDTLQVLRSIDQQIGRLWRATQLAPRPYHLVCLSDHGQTQGQSFAQRFGETIEELVGRLCGGPTAAAHRGHGRQRATEGWQVGAALAEAASGPGFVARRLRDRVERAGSAEHTPRDTAGAPGKVARVAPGLVCVVSGHTAMVSFTDLAGRVPIEEIERRWPALLPSLVDHPGVGFLLVHSTEFGPVVLGRDGVHRLDSGVVIGEDPLAPYGEHAARLVARTSTFPHCADVMINSRFDPATEEASAFEPHVGSHGGLGGPQQRGFLLHPAGFTDPGEIVGAEHLHRVLRGWLTDLGHPDPRAAVPTRTEVG
ncbi:phage holin family protein [Klenkia taihuensis]|nr:phage holin family protein [Klenkia taihuensis]GHE11759.1 membrane protein [Klenkia taihuensis]